MCGKKNRKSTTSKNFIVYANTTLFSQFSPLAAAFIPPAQRSLHFRENKIILVVFLTHIT